MTKSNAPHREGVRDGVYGEDVDAEDYLSRTVHVVEERQWSGLFDSNGKKLYRAKEPIGFIRRSKGE